MWSPDSYILQRQQQLLETSIDQGPSQNDDVDMDDETVPVVVKPGHIRFEPIGKGLMILSNLDSIWLVQWWEQYFVWLKRGWGSVLPGLAGYICLISYIYNMDHSSTNSLIALL